MWTRKMIIDGSFVIGSYYETLSYSNFHIKLTLNPQRDLLLNYANDRI